LSPVLCHPSSYITSFQKSNNVYDAKAVSKQIKYFLDEIHAVEGSCFVLEFEHDMFHYIESYVVCTED